MKSRSRRKKTVPPTRTAHKQSGPVSGSGHSDLPASIMSKAKEPSETPVDPVNYLLQHLREELTTVKESALNITTWLVVAEQSLQLLETQFDKGTASPHAAAYTYIS